ncbi:DUF397 domain-containing protein [Actinophytocola gossypii]|uniref:DUF397 domain-containing protein n=1 Tax=Actinophytocola gossypii TaxID=2812003 RepID=A0ABT2JII1_9PSEU|nr:DUF397 domain-containing protein [Actinophytocola gossypii]MCT2587683.1 DUF397 domain-containing protein [Actinophytocola gossypii]
MGTAPRPPRWRTSSFSSNGTSCVEVWNDLAALRDSKNAEGPALRVDLRGFVTPSRLDGSTSADVPSNPAARRRAGAPAQVYSPDLCIAQRLAALVGASRIGRGSVWRRCSHMP